MARICHVFYWVKNKKITQSIDIGYGKLRIAKKVRSIKSKFWVYPSLALGCIVCITVQLECFEGHFQARSTPLFSTFYFQGKKKQKKNP